MSRKTTYTLEDLQVFEDRCQIEAAKLGFTIPETLFHLVQAEEMYDIAARGLPGRYSHYQFGRAYEEQKGAYDRGRGRIYELVINTRPVHAYLLDGNGLIAQLLVIAHVLGHASVFEHNRYFEPADKNIISRVRSSAERIDHYIGEYGRERVEDFIDAVESLEHNRSYDQLAHLPEAQAPKWEDKPFDLLFPEETKARRDEYKADKEAFKKRFPKTPARDILGFLEKYTRGLEDWQRDVISILRSEMDYFVPQIRTQVLNEAQAVYYHQTIVQQLMIDYWDDFDADDFTEFQSMNASVLHPKIQRINSEDKTDEPVIGCVGMNPYLTGTAIYHEIKRLCETTNPTEKELERWSWAGSIGWDEKRCEVVQTYDDIALLSEFITPSVCEEAKLFIRPRTWTEYHKLRVSEEEAEEVRLTLVKQKMTFGTPVVEITDADYLGRGELLLEHRVDGRGLDKEYTVGTLEHLTELWKHPVVVKTVMKDHAKEDAELEDVWYRMEPGKNAVISSKPPT